MTLLKTEIRNNVAATKRLWTTATAKNQSKLPYFRHKGVVIEIFYRGVERRRPRVRVPYTRVFVCLRLAVEKQHSRRYAFERRVVSPKRDYQSRRNSVIFRTEQTTRTFIEKKHRRFTENGVCLCGDARVYDCCRQV